MTCTRRPPPDALTPGELTTAHDQANFRELPVVLANEQLAVLSLLVQDVGLGLDQVLLLLSLQGEGEELP